MGSLRSFRNDPDMFLAEALGGFVASHPDATWHKEGFISRTSSITTEDGKPAVAIVSGGGSGHEPLHSGMVGRGMLSAAVPGHLFTSPNAVQIREAINFADQGRGVLLVVKNYTGDVMNFRVARNSVDVDTDYVIVADDVATESDNHGPGRRGIAGTVLVEKVAGAAALRGDDLADVTRLARCVADNTRSMSVSLAPGHLATTGRDTFDLGSGEMEVGVGIHGERGTARVSVREANEIVDHLLEDITAALGDLDDVILLVNGLGATTDLELDLMFGDSLKWLADKGIKVRRGVVGNFVTSVDMAGVTLTLTRATDEICELLDAPSAAPGWNPIIAVDPTFAPARMEQTDDVPASGEDNEWLSGFLTRVEGGVDDLTELDRLAGDGDFGFNMRAAFGGLPTPARGNDAELLRALADRLLIRAGGTSGAVFGTMFTEMADAFEEEGSRTEKLANGLQAAADAVAKLGRAKPGDRTMMDALVPAAEAAQGVRDKDFGEALNAIYEPAFEGAKSTGNMLATKGRASYVGEASKGVVDPGSIVVAWLFGGSGKVSDVTGDMRA